MSIEVSGFRVRNFTANSKKLQNNWEQSRNAVVGVFDDWGIGYADGMLGVALNQGFLGSRGR